MRIAPRVMAAVLAVLFALSVAVQHNDPDPLPWMLLYGAACAICVASAAGRRVSVPAAVVAVVAAAWLIALLPDALSWLRSPRAREPVSFTMKTDDPGEELVREAGGLALVVVACAGLGLHRARGRGRDGGASMG